MFFNLVLKKGLLICQKLGRLKLYNYHSIRFLFLMVSMLHIGLLQSRAQNDSSSIEEIDSLTIPVSKNALESEVNYYSKDSIFFDLENQKIYLYNKAWVSFEKMKLEADSIIVDFKVKKVYAYGRKDSSGRIKGKPIFSDKGKKFGAQWMEYDFESRKGLSGKVITKEGEAYIHSKKILRDSVGQIYGRTTRYTTCDLEHPHFWIESKKIKVIPKKLFISGPANLIFEGVRTPLVVPFALFPVQSEKSKGIIFPTYGEDARRGFFLRDFGYFLPINNYLDAMLTGSFYFRGSWAANFQSNYKKRYKYNGNLRLSYAQNFFEQTESLERLGSQDISVRWFFNRDPKASKNSNFRANVDYNTKNYLKNNNSMSYNDLTRNNANSNISWSKSFFKGKLNFSSNARMDQDLAKNQINLTLPNMNTSVSRILPFSKSNVQSKALKTLGFSYNSSFQNRVAVADSNLFIRSTFQDSFDLGVVHRIPISTSTKIFKYFSFSPALNLSDYWYFRETQKIYNPELKAVETQTINNFSRLSEISTSASLTTTVYGQKNFATGSKIKAIRHVIWPSISASWRPDYSKGSFLGYRSVQTDSLGNLSNYNIYDGNFQGRPSGNSSARMGFSLRNNLEMKVRDESDTIKQERKVKIIESFSLSSNYNFLADSLNLGNITMNGNTTLFKKMRINFSGNINPYQNMQDADGRVRKINKLWLAQGKLGALTSVNISMSTSLNQKVFENRQKRLADQGRQNDLDYQLLIDYPDAFVDFSIPWDLRINYNFRYSKNPFEPANSDQKMSFSGSMNLTENWKIELNSGYDFTDNELIATRVNLYRDLHCWEFSFNWIPSGTYRQFVFTLRPKSRTLQDLKINRRRNWWAN